MSVIILTALPLKPEIPEGEEIGIKVGTLPEVLKPEMIQVCENDLFVVERATIYNFSLIDLKLKKKIGKKGEGPGELKVDGFWYNTVTVRPDHLFIDAPDKIIYFSREGEFLKEKKKPANVFQVIPVAENFVGIIQIQVEDKIQYQSVNLYDSNFNFKKNYINKGRLYNQLNKVPR